MPTVTATSIAGGYLGGGNLFTEANRILICDIKPSDGIVGKGEHVGTIAPGASVYSRHFLPSNENTYHGPFPGQGQDSLNGGYFESGNGQNFGAGGYAAWGRWIVVMHHGEGWKGAQTNYFYLMDDSTSLYLENFGESWYYFPNTPSGRQLGIFQAGGNVLGGILILGNDGKLHLLGGDETMHSGIQDWTIDGVNTTSILSGSIVPSGSAPPSPGTDLMAGLNRDVTNVPNGQGGWVRSPTADYSDGTGSTTSWSGRTSYDIFKSPDLFVANTISGSSKTVTFTKQMIAAVHRSTNWQTNFEVSWNTDNAVPNAHTAPPYNSGSYVEILDSVGKIISEFHVSTDFGGHQYIGINGTDVITDSTGGLIFPFETKYRPISVTYTNGLLTMNYGGIIKTSSTPFEAGAVLSQPYSLRIRFFVNTGSGVTSPGKSLGIQNAFFIENLAVPNYPCSGCKSNYFKISKKR